MPNPFALIKKLGFACALHKMKRRIFINDKDIISKISINGAYDYLQKYKYALDFPIEQCSSDSPNPYPDKIWTMWLQGVENAPELIQKCVASVKKYYGNEVIVLTHENIHDFVEIPDVIIEKHQKGIISNTHFADFVRFLVIEKYGGLWLDGTTFLLDSIPDYIRFADIFFYRNVNEKLRASVGVIAAKPHHPLISKTIIMMLEYWKNENRLVSYSITMLLFAMVVNNSAEMRSVYNQIPHLEAINKSLLLLKLFEKYDETHLVAIKQQSVIQQLSWKFSKEKYELEGTFYDKLIKKIKI